MSSSLSKRVINSDSALTKLVKPSPLEILSSAYLTLQSTSYILYIFAKDGLFSSLVHRWSTLRNLSVWCCYCSAREIWQVKSALWLHYRSPVWLVILTVSRCHRNRLYSMACNRYGWVELLSTRRNTCADLDCYLCVLFVLSLKPYDQLQQFRFFPIYYYAIHIIVKPKISHPPLAM